MNKYFGEFGGQYVAETLMNPLIELENAYLEAKDDPEFLASYNFYLTNYSGRPTPLYYAKNLTNYYKKAKIYLKREDLNHTGAHKINNVIGQVLLAKRMGKEKVICETGAGQHGVATATICTLFNLSCEVFMGAEDIRRQAINVSKMELLGAKVTSVTTGSATLADATSAAIRAWASAATDTFYVIGSVVGPHPYPTMVRDFQSIIGTETKMQLDVKNMDLPDYIVACVGGGSNAIGMFYPFLNDESVALYGIEASGHGVDTDLHAATMSKGSTGVLHGMKTRLLQDDYGQLNLAHSVSAGLDYPGVGPEHAFLHKSTRVQYDSITDHEALAAFKRLTKLEGIIPALESSHAIAYLEKLMPHTDCDETVIVNLSGRGDKDMDTVLDFEGGN